MYSVLIKEGKNSCLPLKLALHVYGTGEGPAALVNTIKAYGKVEVQL
jgi:hypothetical protein